MSDVTNELRRLADYLAPLSGAPDRTRKMIEESADTIARLEAERDALRAELAEARRDRFEFDFSRGKLSFGDQYVFMPLTEIERQGARLAVDTANRMLDARAALQGGSDGD